ncbi:MAG: glycerate kinase, partial [Promethearchaeota archaeon]
MKLDSYIKNRNALLSKNLDNAQLKLRKIALNALDKAIDAVRPENLIKNSVKIEVSKLIVNNDTFDLKDYNKIYIIGGGKASALMLKELEKIFQHAPTLPFQGIINVPGNLELNLKDYSTNVEINRASHPIPNENGVKGTKKMMKIVENTTQNDLIICLISGGGSALLPLPRNGLSLNELQKVNSLLLASGASIHEINAIRKHLSKFKGGNLAKKIFEGSGATLISLIISDVVGDDLDSTASGPTVPDNTTFQDCLRILKKYDLTEQIPVSAKQILENGLNLVEKENPKNKDPCFTNVHNYLIGSVKSAVQAATKYLKEKFHVDYFSDEIIGEASDFGKDLWKIISKKVEDFEVQNENMNLALIGSGELTVTIKGNGIGGRNQEMLLAFLEDLKDNDIHHNFSIIAANLDGIEGNSSAMGALVDNHILDQIHEKKLDLNIYLKNNDSNTFFKKINSEIITGPTGCNVNDLIIILNS